MLLTFPSFNVYSSPLLLLSIQGVIFCMLLLVRFFRSKNLPDLFLSLILIITCYHQTTYTLGFMDWYDTFRNTKINYYLLNASLMLAPILYFYIKSIVSPDFKFQKKDLLHFVPWSIYLLIKLVILVYDSSQPGYEEVQNGYLTINFEWTYLVPFLFLFSILQMLLYLTFSFQLLYAFREKIQHYFSNSYKLELNWVRNFLFVYSFLYLFNSVQTIIDNTIVDLSWIQEWWYYLLSGIAIIYVGIKGYYTNLFELSNINFDSFQVKKVIKNQVEDQKKQPSIEPQKKEIEAFFESDRPYLDPELTLISLAESLGISREELSEIINRGFSLKFNDFINGYRIRDIQQRMLDGDHKKLSLLGIAYDCGFNSKATFNRAFKKALGVSPSDYLNAL